jgi:hypothetical protein
VEADRHPFEPIYERLPNEFGFAPQGSPEEEIYRMFELLMQPEIKARIEQKRHLILPRTWWSGMKRRAETLEVLDGGGMPEEEAEGMKVGPSYVEHRA